MSEQIVIGHTLEGTSDSIQSRMASAAAEGLVLICVLPDGRPMFRRGVDAHTNEAFKLIEGDPHQWGSRPCTTCRLVSQIIKRPFGCSRKEPRNA